MVIDPSIIIIDAIIISISTCIVVAGIIIPIGFWWYRRRANKITTESLR